MTNPHLKRHVAIALAMFVPFVILPPLTAWSADHLAKAGAARWRTMSSGRELVLSAAQAWSVEDGEPTDDVAVAVDLSPLTFTTARVGGERAGVPRARRPHHIFVGPDMIRRAIPPSARPKSTWTDRSGDRPAGMLIQSPGVLAGTIVPRDVLFEAEGQPIPSPEQLVALLAQTYPAHANYPSGRPSRHGKILPSP